MRQPAAEKDTHQELSNIDSRSAASSVGMILDVIKNPEAAQQAPAGAYDATGVTGLRVFQIGDGETLFGLLITGSRQERRVPFLVFLID